MCVAAIVPAGLTAKHWARQTVSVSQVRVVVSKWGGRPHWEYDAIRLGNDLHGTWLGIPFGTLMSRPGATFRTDQGSVMLVPPASPFVATFYDEGGSSVCAIYVDVTTPPTWDGSTLRMVDLDLDVVKGWTGRVWIDDEDEFADHRTRFGYPTEIVSMALDSCDDVLKSVESRAAPYDAKVSRRWLSKLDRPS